MRYDAIGMDRTQRYRTRHEWARQDTKVTGQDRTGQDKTVQDRTGQDGASLHGLVLILL